MAINIFQLLFGLAIFVYSTLYAVIYKIWTPTVEPYLYTSTNKTRTKNKKTKGKKGKSSVEEETEDRACFPFTPSLDSYPT